MISPRKLLLRLKKCEVRLTRIDELTVKKNVSKKLTGEAIRLTCSVCDVETCSKYFGIQTCRACADFFRKVKRSKVLTQLVKTSCVKSENHTIKKCRPCRARMCVQVGFKVDDLSSIDIAKVQAKESPLSQPNPESKTLDEPKKPKNKKRKIKNFSEKNLDNLNAIITRVLDDNHLSPKKELTNHLEEDHDPKTNTDTCLVNCSLETKQKQCIASKSNNSESAKVVKSINNAKLEEAIKKVNKKKIKSVDRKSIEISEQSVPISKKTKKVKKSDNCTDTGERKRKRSPAPIVNTTQSVKSPPSKNKKLETKKSGSTIKTEEITPKSLAKTTATKEVVKSSTSSPPTVKTTLSILTSVAKTAATKEVVKSSSSSTPVKTTPTISTSVARTTSRKPTSLAKVASNKQRSVAKKASSKPTSVAKTATTTSKLATKIMATTSTSIAKTVESTPKSKMKESTFTPSAAAITSPSRMTSSSALLTFELEKDDLDYSDDEDMNSISFSASCSENSSDEGDSNFVDLEILTEKKFVINNEIQNDTIRHVSDTKDNKFAIDAFSRYRILDSPDCDNKCEEMEPKECNDISLNNSRRIGRSRRRFESDSDSSANDDFEIRSLGYSNNNDKITDFVDSSSSNLNNKSQIEFSKDENNSDSESGLNDAVSISSLKDDHEFIVPSLPLLSSQRVVDDDSDNEVDVISIFAPNEDLLQVNSSSLKGLSWNTQNENSLPTRNAFKSSPKKNKSSTLVGAVSNASSKKSSTINKSALVRTSSNRISKASPKFNKLLTSVHTFLNVASKTSPVMNNSSTLLSPVSNEATKPPSKLNNSSPSVTAISNVKRPSMSPSSISPVKTDINMPSIPTVSFIPIESEGLRKDSTNSSISATSSNCKYNKERKR